MRFVSESISEVMSEGVIIKLSWTVAFTAMDEGREFVNKVMFEFILEISEVFCEVVLFEVFKFRISVFNFAKEVKAEFIF